MTIPYISVLPPLPPRPEQSHKGTFGHALLIAGSRGMSGAACLAGRAALRGGAGLVTVAVPASVLPVVAGAEPSYLTHPLPEDGDVRISGEATENLLELCGKCTAIGCGPGWGQSPALTELIWRLYSEVRRPLLVDADGLNGLAAHTGPLPQTPDDAPRILTPHPGEFARLLQIETADVQRDREGLAVEFAGRNHVVLVLKGHETLITDGHRLAVNTTGNSGMATGGTGDVLTGLLTALLAQRMPAFDAAHLAAHVHGLAGDLAASHLTKIGLMASDLIAYLPHAWKQLGA